MTTSERWGRVGVWTWTFDRTPWTAVADAAAEIEELGYGAVWFGEGPGRDAPTQAALLLSHTRRLAVTTAVATLHRHEPATLAQAERTLAEAFPGRFALGLGVSSRGNVEAAGKEWGGPVRRMRDYLDAMDAATLTGPGPATPAPRLLAALGPRMLGLAAERTAGAHPYFLPVEHTAQARAILGPGPVLAAHQMVALDPDPARARERARWLIGGFLEQSHHVPSRWRRIVDLLGFDGSDLAGGGSERLVDALVAHGDLDAVVGRLRDQLDAGADHVAVEPVPDTAGPPMSELRALAPALADLGASPAADRVPRTGEG